VLAYQTGAFAGLAFNGKLKSFDHYRPKTETPVSNHVRAIGFFHAMRAKGLPVRIERVERVH
jgi:hypothetical protein